MSAKHVYNIVTRPILIVCRLSVWIIAICIAVISANINQRCVIQIISVRPSVQKNVQTAQRIARLRINV
jgi:hypothetical protein